MSIGRVGNNQLTRKLLFQLQSQIEQQERLFEQISSNKRILRPSDDPVGTSKAMHLRDQLNRINEYDTVAKAADVWTNVTTASLDGAVSTWKRVNEIAIAAADGTKTAEDRQGMAEELEQLLQHLVQIGNTTHGGRYIFSGGDTDKPAFEAETDANTGRITGVFYRGDNTIRSVTTKDGGTVPVNIVGSNAGDPNTSGAFIDSTANVNAFTTLITLRDKLLANDTIGLSGTGGVINDVETAARSLAAAQTRVGGSQEILDLDKNRIIEDTAIVDKHLADIEDADTVQLILELNNLQNVYEAALAAGGRLLQTGLINFI